MHAAGDRFWTIDRFGNRVNVIPMHGGLLGRPYLKTEPDGNLFNNLLNLPAC